MSPGNLVEIGVAGCMLLSMEALAQRDKLDLKGTVVDIGLTETDEPFAHVDTITLIFNIPEEFSATDGQKLEKAAGMCPIKASFREGTVITAKYNYGTEAVAVA